MDMFDENTAPKNFAVNNNTGLIGGPILIVFSIALIFVSINGKAADGSGAFLIFIFSLLLLLGIYEISYSLRWRVTVFEGKLTVRPFIGKTRTYLFSDITNVEIARGRIIVYNHVEKIFSIDMMIRAVNYNLVNNADCLIDRFQKENIKISL